MLLLWTFLFATSVVHADKWAVLVAGSNGYYNYRHQADISHAYTLLTTKGNFKKENVILMMYDDVAHSSENPDPGTLINHPKGKNVYPGSQAVDYKKDECNAANVLKVLNGTAKGKVLGSGPDDLVFFYFADHGAPGLVAMPVGDPLYAKDLLETFSWMHENNKFKEMAVYIEACESGSMMNTMPKNIKIYGTTAATPDESSYATYWDDKLQTYLGDEYSVNWMEDSEANWDADTETLLTQYLNVRKRTNHSHPQMYGDKTKGFEKVRHFQDENDARRSLDSDPSLILFSDSRDVKLNTLKNRAALAKNPIDFIRQRKLIESELAMRNSFETIFMTVAMTMMSIDNVEHYISHLETDEIDFECLKSAYSHFESKCMKWTDYGLKYVTALVNFCNDQDTETIKQTTTEICGNYFGRNVFRAQ